MKPAIVTVILLIISNVFMTLAWYGHLKLQSSGVSSNWPLYAVILISWGIALVEYVFYDSGQPYGLRRQRWPVFSGSAEGDAGVYNSGGVYSVHDDSVQRHSLRMELIFWRSCC